MVFDLSYQFCISDAYQSLMADDLAKTIFMNDIISLCFNYSSNLICFKLQVFFQLKQYHHLRHIIKNFNFCCLFVFYYPFLIFTYLIIILFMFNNLIIMSPYI